MKATCELCVPRHGEFHQTVKYQCGKKANILLWSFLQRLFIVLFWQTNPMSASFCVFMVLFIALAYFQLWSFLSYIRVPSWGHLVSMCWHWTLPNVDAANCISTCIELSPLIWGGRLFVHCTPNVRPLRLAATSCQTQLSYTVWGGGGVLGNDTG